MPVYAVLGATSATGCALVDYLHSRQESAKTKDMHLNIYARSAPKLSYLFLYAKTASNISTFSGDITNPNVLKPCLQNATVIFSVLGQNISEPGCSIAQRTAYSTISALTALRKEQGPGFKCPTVIFLTSAFTNPHFRASMPKRLVWVFERGCYHIHQDFTKAVTCFRDQPWIPLITAEAPAPVHDVSQGWALSTDTVTPFLSYDDLAGAMVQMAEEDKGRKWLGKSVGISATGKVENAVLPLIWLQIVGLLAYYVPSLWWLGYGRFW